MEYLIGAAVAIAVWAFAASAGFDRDRAFYPTVLIVTASYYILFAVMGSSTLALISESLLAAIFVIAAAVGFRRTLWLVVAGFAGHGTLDLVHHLLVQNPGVPSWWLGFCLAFDVMAAVILGLLLKRRAGFATAG